MKVDDSYKSQRNVLESVHQITEYKFPLVANHTDKFFNYKPVSIICISYNMFRSEVLHFRDLRMPTQVTLAQ